MSSPDVLVSRVKGEYREMPGLKLTFAQACRLWCLERAACEAVLQALLEEGFLGRTADGAFVALPSPGDARATPLKAQSPAPRQAHPYDVVRRDPVSGKVVGELDHATQMPHSELRSRPS